MDITYSYFFFLLGILYTLGGIGNRVLVSCCPFHTFTLDPQLSFSTRLDSQIYNTCA